MRTVLRSKPRKSATGRIPVTNVEANRESSRKLRPMRSLRAMAILAAFVPLVIAAGPQASADTPLVGSGANAGCGYGQTCAGGGQLVPVGLGSATVEFSCSATTPFRVQATIVQCWIRHNAGGAFVDQKDANVPAAAVTLQGNESETNGAYLSVPLESYEVCIRAGYVALNGDIFPPSNASCFVPV